MAKKGKDTQSIVHPKAHATRSVDISLPTRLEKGVDIFLDAGYDFGVSSHETSHR